MGEPATKADLQDLKTELKADLQQVRAELKADLHQVTAGLLSAFQAALQDTETKLLKAFFAYQEHADLRFRKMSADISNINASSEMRINNLEQRVIELEKHYLSGGSQRPPQ